MEAPKSGHFTIDRDFCEMAPFVRVRQTTLRELPLVGYDLFKVRRRPSFRDAVEVRATRLSLQSYCFNEAVLGSCAFCRGFVLFAAGAFLAEGLLMLLACCSCFWSFLPAACLVDAGFICAVLAGACLDGACVAWACFAFLSASL